MCRHVMALKGRMPTEGIDQVQKSSNLSILLLDLRYSKIG